MLRAAPACLPSARHAPAPAAILRAAPAGGSPPNRPPLRVTLPADLLPTSLASARPLASGSPPLHRPPPVAQLRVALASTRPPQLALHRVALPSAWPCRQLCSLPACWCWARSRWAKAPPNRPSSFCEKQSFGLAGGAFPKRSFSKS